MTWTPADLAAIPTGTRDPMEAYRERREQQPEPEPEPPAEIELVSPSIDLASVPTDPPPPMLVERLDPEGHTILFGTGGVGKGALACYWIAQLVAEGTGVLIVDYERHPAEWSRRIASLAPTAHASGRIRHWSPATKLYDCGDMVAAEARGHELGVVVVDSAVMACGSDPLKPEVAAEYDAAIMAIGLPVLSLAHVTKADDMRYPFGSIFWHNLARTTWGLQLDKSGTVVLSHRKHNNYASKGRFAVSTTWSDGRLMEVWEKPHHVALKDRIAEVLRELGPASLDSIVEALASDEEEGAPLKKDTVRRVMQRYLVESFRFDGVRYEVVA